MKPVPFCPELKIDAVGTVWKDGRRVPTTSMTDRNGVAILSVTHGNSILSVWDLMSAAHYDNRFILPDDGNFLDCRKDRIIDVKLWHSPINNTDTIHYIWSMYNGRIRLGAERDWSGIKAGCNQIGEVLNLSEESIRRVISDIVVQGIR